MVEGTLFDATADAPLALLDLTGVASLPGRHNWQNAAAAYAACKATGLDPPVIAACLRSFPGLPHRQELVALIDGVAFVNDSKATNADAAVRALACYREIFWIAGGLPKEGGLAALLSEAGRIEAAFLIGQAAEAFAAELGERVPHRACGTLDRAVGEASAAARDALAQGRCREPVVLLSPACASFDQFSDFEARGEAFKQAVEALPGERGEIHDWVQGAAGGAGPREGERLQ